MKVILRGLLVAAALVALPGGASAKEPVEQFLERLRQRKLFDAAEWYLESLRTNPNVDAATRQIIPFEQGRIIVEMSAAERVTSERLKKLDAAKLLFDEFLKANPNHSFAGLAQVQLGNLMVERGTAWVGQAEREKKPEDKKKLLADAVKEFQAARKVIETAVAAFDAKVKKFPSFVPPGPERTKKNDARRDLIEAGIYLGNCIYQQAQAYDKASKERKQYLTEAATAFQKLHQLFRDRFAGVYAGTWEARCYQEMDDLPRALGVYIELMNTEGGDENVRGLQIKALRMAMECWNDKRQQKYEAAEKAAEDWLRAARGDEEDSPDGLAIVFLLAQANHLWLDTEKRTDPKEKADPRQKANKLTAKQREDKEKRIKFLLQRVISGRSDYRKQAQELYAIYGKLDPNALPTNFADAYDQAKGKFAVSTGKGEERDDDKRPQAERDKAAADATAAALDAIKLFRLSLTFKDTDKSINLEDLHTIRYYLTFLYYGLGRYQEAAIQGEFLARNYPQFSAANHAGFIAMAAWVYLYNDAQAVNGKKLFETGNLVRVAELLAAKWPDSQYADNAWLMLADIRIREQDFKGAAEYLEKIAPKSERRSDADLKHGQALWSQYLRLRNLKLRNQPGAATDAELDAIRDKSEKLLKQGIDAKRKAAADASAVTEALLVSELSLAQLLVNRGSVEHAKAALAVLSKKDGILALYEKADEKTKRVALEALKVLLRAYVSTREIEKAKKTLADLDKLFVGEAAAGRSMFYRALGEDVSAQLKTAPPAEQEALEKAFHEFTEALTAKPEALDDNTLIWAAESNLGIAEAALKRGTSARPKAKELCESAARLYKQLMERRTAAKAKAAEDKDEAAVKKADGDLIILTIRLGRAQRLAQDYDASFKTLSELLLRDDNILDAQIEICDTFLDWGADLDLLKFKLARQGVRPKGAKKQPIWGLAMTRKKLQPYVTAPPGGEGEEDREKRLAWRERFFETDLKLCKSLLTHAEHEKTPAAEKKQLLEAGVKFIAGLFNVYAKELESSKEWYDAYDALLKDLQRASGQEPTGLKSLVKPSDGNTK